MAEEVKSGYKMTDVGYIPEDWEVKTLGEVLEIGYGCDYKHLKSGNIPVYGTGGIITYVNDYLFDGDSVGIGRKGTITNPIRLRNKFWTVDTLFYTHSFKGVIADFIYYLFQTIYWDDYNEATGVPSLTAQAICNIFVQIPSLSEQRKISEALSAMDDMILQTEQAIAKKQLIKKGMMQQLLTGKTRLDGFDGEWEEKRLGDIGNTYTGLAGKTQSDFGRGSAKYITFLNVLNNPIIDNSIFEKVDVKNGENQNEVGKFDLLFNTSSETPEEVGICSLYLGEEENVYLNSFCFGFRPFSDKYDGLFLSYYFRSAEARQMMETIAQGATRYNLSKEYFLDATILVPPTLSEQTAIAKVFSSMDEEINGMEAMVEKYRKVKKGMMQELLTGKTRLI